jgi:hypothetical protein
LTYSSTDDECVYETIGGTEVAGAGHGSIHGNVGANGRCGVHNKVPLCESKLPQLHGDAPLARQVIELRGGDGQSKSLVIIQLRLPIGEFVLLHD